MGKAHKPQAPKALHAPGKALWKSILDDLAPDWELDPRELHLLARACRCADELHELEKSIDRDGVTSKGSRNQTVTHPALVEARQLRLVQLRLLGSIELTDPRGAARTPASSRARRAANVRWDLERKAS